MQLFTSIAGDPAPIPNGVSRALQYLRRQPQCHIIVAREKAATDVEACTMGYLFAARAIVFCAARESGGLRNLLHINNTFESHRARETTPSHPLLRPSFFYPPHPPCPPSLAPRYFRCFRWHMRLDTRDFVVSRMNMKTEHSQQDLLQRILKKDAERRLTVTEARGHHWVRSKLDADAGVGTRLGWGSGSVAASSDVGTGLSMRSRGTKFDAAAATTADGSQSTLKIFKGGAPVADSSASTTAAYSSVDTIDADPMVASHGPTEKIFPGGPAKDAVAAATVAVAVAAAAPTGTASASVAGKVAISEEDVRAAVREAPGSVVLVRVESTTPISCS